MFQPDPVRFAQPLKAAEVLTPAYPAECEKRFAERERTAFELGVIDGQRALGIQLTQQRVDLMELQSGILQSLRRAVPEVALAVEDELVKMALTVAIRLVGSAAIDAAVVRHVVTEAIANATEAPEMSVVLHPDDLLLLQAAQEGTGVRIGVESGLNQVINFEAGIEVPRGGCLVKTPFGLIDARRDTQVQKLRQSLLGDAA